MASGKTVDKTSRLLLVEDDAFTVELVRRALARGGVAAEVTVARSGEEALRRAQGMVRAGAAPDLVLLDLRPRGAGGLEVLAALRAAPALSRCPVVVYTGSTTPTDEAAARAAGADGFFVKPDAFGDLVERMRRLGRWLAPAAPAR